MRPPTNPLDVDSPETIRWLASDRADHFEKLVREKRSELSRIHDEVLPGLREARTRAVDAFEAASERCDELEAQIQDFSAKASHLRAVEGTTNATFEMLMKEP